MSTTPKVMTPFPSLFTSSEGTLSVFDVVTRTLTNTQAVLEMIEQANPNARNSSLMVAVDIQQLCAHSPDAMLAALHLQSDRFAYPIYHPLHQAVLCEILSESFGLPEHDRRTLVCAALTANVSIIALQETLFYQETPLTEDQRDAVRRHPQESLHLLRAAGISNPFWLKIVAQHDEYTDGTGSPKGLKGKEIIHEAQILSVCDRYTALLSPRSYRHAIPATEALNRFFKEIDKQYNKTIVHGLLAHLSLYPPGCFVRLSNMEVGIVVRRGEPDPARPMVVVFEDASGRRLEEPVLRDCFYDLSIKTFCSPSDFQDLNYETIWHSATESMY